MSSNSLRTRVASRLDRERWEALRAGSAAREGLAPGDEPSTGLEHEAARVERIRRVHRK